MSTVAESTTGELCVLSREGDTKLIWNTGSEAEIEAAETMFTSLRAKGYIAYKVKKNGDKGEVLTEFDPQAEKIIMAPPVVGG